MLIGISTVGTIKCRDRSPGRELKELKILLVVLEQLRLRGSIPLPTTALWCSGSTGGSNPPGPGSTRWQGDQ